MKQKRTVIGLLLDVSGICTVESFLLSKAVNVVVLDKLSKSRTMIHFFYSKTLICKNTPTSTQLPPTQSHKHTYM